MKRTLSMALLGSVAMATVVSVAPAAQAGQSAQSGRPEVARLVVVQAVPGESLDVEIDRRSVSEDSDTGAVLGPFDVEAGSHQVAFRDAAGEILLETSVEVTEGSRQDLVVHLPAEVGGDPVATVYETPTAPIGLDKARVLIAHTASVAPADVRVDGTVVFRNIANGEFATAELPAGDHVAELLPAGLTRRPILGPLNVTLPAETATMIYAIGDPKMASMKVISHSITLAADGAEMPTRIDAGSAGLAAGIGVTPFSASTPVLGDVRQGQGPLFAYAAAFAALLAMAVGFGTRRRSAADATR